MSTHSVALRIIAVSGVSLNSDRQELRDAADHIIALEVERDVLAAKVAHYEAEYQDVAGMTILRDERDALKAMMEVIARQHNSQERETYDEEDGDIDGAYDAAIEVARAALQPSERDA